MKKKISKFIFIMVICFALTGCGHKSKEELTDIEQFKCSSSIETVFKVLGKTEISTWEHNGEYYCKYENLNLWGYKGEAVFEIRDDMDTISEFYCVLTLNKNEFSGLISIFDDKYGSHEIHDYGNSLYKWSISDEKTKDLGYDTIYILEKGDKKVEVSFFDKYTIWKDEVYYQQLEEEKEVTTLAEKTYNIGEDTFNFSLGQRGNGEYSFMLLCRIENKSDAYMAHVSLNAIFNSDEEALKAITETMNFAYSIIIGDGTVLLRSKDILYLSKNGEMIGANDYFSVDWILNDEEKNWDYGTQVINFLVDFIQNE